MISVPFQNTINYNIGPNDRAQDILKIEPVIPVHLSAGSWSSRGRSCRSSINPT